MRAAGIGLIERVCMVIAIFLLLSAQPAYAEERSFEIGEVEIHARLDSDGNMHVTELDTYHFDGAFNGVIVELNTSGSDGIDQFQAFEVRGEQHIPLQFDKSENGAKLEYRVYAQSTDETKVFQFTYSFKNVAQIYADTAELYWKFFDQTNPSTLGTVRIDIELPGGVKQEEITAFGHGPLHGAINTEINGIVRYLVSPLPSKEMLEVRILFPDSYIPGSTKISDAAMLDKIMEEEQRWASDTGLASVIGAIALLMANLIVGVTLYVKYGKTYTPSWKGKYYREIPSDVTPAVVSYLLKYRTKPSDLLSTMVDLTRKKYVEMDVHENDKKGKSNEYTFQLIRNPTDELQPHETKLIDWFFGQLGRAGVVSISDIRTKLKGQAYAAEFTKNWAEWQASVAETVDQLSYIEPKNSVRTYVNIAVIVQFFGFLFFAAEDWKWLMFCALPLLFFKPKRKRRTAVGQSEYVKWRAFKRFLRDYSQIASRAPLSVHLWEHYFVYAIPLGEAKRMKEIGRLEVPQMETDNNHVLFDASFAYSYNSWVTSIEKTISEANKSANPSQSSDGSFSSGGGGGGGGGGRGAF